MLGEEDHSKVGYGLWARSLAGYEHECFVCLKRLIWRFCLA
ncbi:hypothetical protein [Streptomyces albipurpureus]|nr:hypothetical protein [Streptomyces sp. CWNU-1]